MNENNWIINARIIYITIKNIIITLTN